MSASVLEPPALVRSPEEGQHGSCEPEHILTQLSAALENPDIKALEWSKDGQSILVHVKLYEEEMRKNNELFPEMACLGSVAALQVWLVAYGFKLKEAKISSQVLLLKHPYFQRQHPTAEEPGDLGDDKEKKKKKKERHASSSCLPRGATSQDTPRKRPCLRPLYQYINFDMPELMQPPAEEEEVPELAQPSHVPAAPRGATAPQLEDTWAHSAPEIPAPEVNDTSMQVDIDRMLRYTAHLIPQLFPQYK